MFFCINQKNYAHVINGDKMKKKLLTILILSIIIITGCELNNNPTAKAEELLGKYQSLNKKINYIELSNEKEIPNNLKKEYENLIKKQYRNMNYEVKEEKIDGIIATVTVEIEVLNYKSVIEKYPESSEERTETIHKKIIKELKKVKDKTIYTIDFKIVKNNKNWQLEATDTAEEKKLLGIY